MRAATPAFSKPSTDDITGVILAGGRGRRLGGHDKGLIPLAGKPMIGYVIRALAHQTRTIIINANRNISAYEAFGYPVIRDHSGGYAGPLAGIISAMRASSTTYILTAPCDTPLLPHDLATRMSDALQNSNAEVCTVHDGERLQPVIALLPCRLADDLQRYLDGGSHKVTDWIVRQNYTVADYSGHSEAFRNINTPDELRRVENILTCLSE